ncbi:IclR family transcriptional regulator [Salinisphaera sp.]|uniref:IclR family transcriptional regulator n=1 Tax=Salinisphaera sp. TaxID=1914330 RepID=UPI002D7657AE|nr:IclR family transcriptional regulator [Salinisphaera sp.]HET7313556.1 IclR family transcriptional regulator [Salinisphaera sp.]
MSSFHKAIALLALIADSPTPPRFTDLLSASGRPKATLHRLLGALASEGLITLDEPTQTYRPGLRLLELAHRSWLSLDLRSIAAADVDRLTEQTGETVHLAVLDGSQIVYIDKRESGNSLRLFSAIGKRGPLYCTGVGKAILAALAPAALDTLLATTELAGHTPTTITDDTVLRTELAAVRERGCAYDIEEHEQGIRCVAAAIVEASGRIVGGLSVTAPTVRMTGDRMEALGPLVIDAADRIAEKHVLLH